MTIKLRLYITCLRVNSKGLADLRTDSQKPPNSRGYRKTPNLKKNQKNDFAVHVLQARQRYVLFHPLTGAPCKENTTIVVDKATRPNALQIMHAQRGPAKIPLNDYDPESAE